MRRVLSFLLVLVSVLSNHQHMLAQVSEVGDYMLLFSDHESIRENNILNEKILDMVEVYTTDSTYQRKTERHQIFGGVILRMLGFRWKTINYKREKFVGTVNYNYIGFDQDRHEGEVFTEYDVNFDLYPNLEKYKHIAHRAYLAQGEMFKARKVFDKDEVPFIFPDSSADLRKYRMRCECTPHRDFRDLLNDEFYPARPVSTIKEHISFGEIHPSIGVYGPYVLDCNHKCHPEIHPYEWVYWLDVNPKTEHSTNLKSWKFAFVRDYSKRFKHWSSSPRIGEISFPFVFPLSSNEKLLIVEHQFYNRMYADQLKTLNLPKDIHTFTKELTKVIPLNDQTTIRIVWNQSIASEGIVYYINELTIDEENELVYGKFNIAVAVSDIYVGNFISSFGYPENKVYE